MKINNVRGDLTDISAKKEALYRRVNATTSRMIRQKAIHAADTQPPVLHKHGSETLPATEFLQHFGAH